MTSSAGSPRRLRSEKTTSAFARQVGLGRQRCAAISTSQAVRATPRGSSPSPRGLAAASASPSTIMRRSPMSLRPTLTTGRKPSATAGIPQSYRERVEALWSARVNRRLRGRSGDTRQSFRAKVIDELEEITLEHRREGVVFRAERVEHDAEGSVVSDQPPGPRADRVEPEIDAGLEVEDHDLAVQLTERDVGIDRDHGAQREPAHWRAVPRTESSTFMG